MRFVPPSMVPMPFARLLLLILTWCCSTPNCQGMGGEEVAQVIRGMKGNQPIIAAVSGHASTEHKKRCAEAGSDHYLLKPVDPVAYDQLVFHEAKAVRQKYFALKQGRIEVCFALTRSELEFGNSSWICRPAVKKPRRSRALRKSAAAS